LTIELALFAYLFPEGRGYYSRDNRAVGFQAVGFQAVGFQAMWMLHKPYILMMWQVGAATTLPGAGSSMHAARRPA
jgi:hypothetical protein